ncbi:MAG: fused MFS/spermidine synthase [Myxococcota bacterium]
MRHAAFAAFFLSGASSLVFQNLWGRMLHHVFGATGVAVSTVVTVFMVGLGLGAWLGGRVANRLRHPLLAYAAAELVVGAWALLVPTLLHPEGWLAEVNRWLRGELGAESIGFMLGRFAFVLPVLVVPTTLMGATLPLLARHFVRDEQAAGAVGSRVGALYAVNTFGAVAGVLLAGFLLMPQLGVRTTNAVAVAVNVSLAAGIALLHARTRRAPRAAAAASSRPEPPGGPRRPPMPRWARRVVLFAFGASGAAALAYEVAWTRALAMTIGASVYSFTLILGTFLIGIAGGSAVASAVLWNRGRLLTATAAASTALALLACTPWAVADGVIAWAVTGTFASAAVWLVWHVARVRMRVVRLPGAEPGATGPVLVMLAVPTSAAALHAAVFGDLIAGIVLAVTVTVAALFALLVVLRPAPVLQLGVVQLFVGAATFVNYVVQDELPCAFADMVQSLPQAAGHVGAVQGFMFLAAALCTLPATLGMGAMFPLTLRLWTGGGQAAARDVGLVYATNTLGSIAGAWIPGFVLMPLLGLERTLHLGMGLNLVLALLLILASGAVAGAVRKRRSHGGDRDPRRGSFVPRWHAATVYVLAPLLPLLGALLHLGTASPQSPLRWNLGRMTLGVFRMPETPGTCEEEVWGSPDIVYYRDGLASTVSVERWDEHLVLKNNGKADASNGHDMPTQIMVSALPLLMHPAGSTDLDVAMVGFGSGVSVGAALQFPIRHLEAVELERSVVEASRWFGDENHLEYGRETFPWVTNERLRVHNDDGRNFLASSPDRYDVIINEPSNPWITGVSDLFTAEHFRITRKRLEPGGIYCQWVQLYELSPRNIKTIMRTFASEFEHVVVFSAAEVSTDAILLGSDAPLPLDLERVRRAMAHPRVREELERAGVTTPHDVLARVLLADREEVMRYARIERRRVEGRWVSDPGSLNGLDEPCEEGCRRVPAPLNTDDNARIEFSAPKDLIEAERFRTHVSRIYSDGWPYGRLADGVRGLPADAEAAAEDYAGLAQAVATVGRKGEALRLAARAARSGEHEELHELLRLLAGEGDPPPPPIEPPESSPDTDAARRRQLATAYEALVEAMAEGAHGPALEAIEAIPRDLRERSGPGLRFLHAYLLYMTDDEARGGVSRAAEELEELVRSEERWTAQHPAVLYYLARAQDADWRPGPALRSMRRYARAARAANAN